MINKATLLGRVGKKDSRDLKNGGLMTSLSVATSRKYVDSKGESQVITVWHNINFFNKLAEIVQKYAHVGEFVYVEGEINNHKIEKGDKAGQWHYSVTGSEIKFIPSGKKRADDSTREAPRPEVKSHVQDNSYDDGYEEFDPNEIPF